MCARAGLYPSLSSMQLVTLEKIRKDICFTANTKQITNLRDIHPIYTILTPDPQHSHCIKVYKKEFGGKEVERKLVIKPNGEITIFTVTNGACPSEELQHYLFSDKAIQLMESILKAKMPKYADVSLTEEQPIFTHNKKENTYCDRIVLTRTVVKPILYNECDNFNILTRKVFYLLSITRSGVLLLQIRINGKTSSTIGADYFSTLQRSESGEQPNPYLIPEPMLRKYFVKNIFPHLEKNSPPPLRSRL